MSSPSRPFDDFALPFPSPSPSRATSRRRNLSVDEILNSTRSSEASEFTSPPSRHITTGRRRMLNRSSRAETQPAGASQTFNPEATEFVPSLKMPSKRKASSSSTKPGKANQSSSKAASLGSTYNDIPLIKSKDIFGGSDLLNTTASSVYLSDVGESSDEDIDAYDVNFPPLNALQAWRTSLGGLPTAVRHRFRSRLNQVRAEDSNTGAKPRKLSAMLIQHEIGSYDFEPSSFTNPLAEKVRYLPLCPAEFPPAVSEYETKNFLTVLPNHRDRIQGSQHPQHSTSAVWPGDELPVELFDLITQYLSRDDVKSMRLVDREFERKVSRSLFYTSVVPFNTELYDMIDEDKKMISRTSRPQTKKEGKKKALWSGQAGLHSEIDIGSLKWQNAKEDKDGKVYKGHGLRVFQGFGPHIKRFGMSFEVSEKQLTAPPFKKELDHVESYHGSYDWPSRHYARFANLAGLENTADETTRMKAAFSNLEIVQELALSVDSGLGWLNGPDKSIRAKIFERPTAVFGTAYDVPDHAWQAATEFWSALRQSQQSFDQNTGLQEVSILTQPLFAAPMELDGLRGKIYADPKLWSALDGSKIMNPGCSFDLNEYSVLYTTQRPFESGEFEASQLPLIPGLLKKEQREWLLETQWAQQAFLESYVLSVVDNPLTFANVITLNIAKLSSRFLSMLSREVFWDGLPCLTNVILQVAPDWRTVEKDDAGIATTKSQDPSDAVRIFHKDVLRDRISLRQSIKKLTIGWVGGGEHAEGMFARNNNILPAPITQLHHCTSNSSLFGLVFKHVEHLTLSNCWITPPTLEGLVKSHSSKALKKLTLNSVSLTAHPKFPANAQGVGIQQGFAQAIANLQAQFQQQFPGQAPPFPAPNMPGVNPQNPQQLALLQQQWQQHFQQMNLMFQGNMNVPNGAAANANPPNLQALAAGNAMPMAIPAAPNNNNNNQAPSHWTAGHREGSWPELLDSISPGPSFNDYLPAPQPWEEPLPERPETTLQAIEFKSCGYARLPNHGGFDQVLLEPDLARNRAMSPWFSKRHAALKSVMMESRDRNLGQIVQYMPPTELDALRFAWGLTEGWADPAKADEPTFDGCQPGGTGRVSGVIERGMALVGRPETGGAPSRAPAA